MPETVQSGSCLMSSETIVAKGISPLDKGHFITGAYIETYCRIGRDIVEFEQGGDEKAEYGAEILNRLSRDLTDRYGKGFGRSNLFNMRKLYVTYPKIQTLSGLLSWSHYIELLKIDDPLERSFYEKESVLKLAAEGQIIEKPEDILKEPYGGDFRSLQISGS